MTEMEQHILFTDGSSLGNPGPGGWGTVLILIGERVIELGGAEKKTTNNRMELTALIRGLERLHDEAGDLVVYLDSSYVEKGAREWSLAWKKNGWKTKGKTDVENRDLWEILLPLIEDRKKFGHVSWKRIPGHAGITGNERADEIATGFASGDEITLFEGDLADYALDILHIAVNDDAMEKRTATRSRMRAKAYSYLSLVHGVAKRHGTWEDCEKRVKGKAGAKYKKALSPDDENAILSEWGVTL